jgi:aspartyl-tRNA(Asn)/glutamyl-tRNA(Gln) amidotransferase subunit B
MEYEADIGLEIHAELLTRSKMFCSCAVVDSTSSQPNTTVCPVCAGMPGVLPVVNEKAVELAMRAALALGCKINHTSLFARKNYFYPDLPKGYQISQFEYPLAENGRWIIDIAEEERLIRIRRAHLEEDTGKLTHVHNEGESFSRVDLNRAGVPLLEIVSEPDMHSVEEMRSYASGLRSLLRTLGASSGDMEKGALRFEANVSVRPAGSTVLGTRVEIKNLNSFRSLERATAYQIGQQKSALARGETISQETLGWDETSETTFSQRSKEEAHDYRYFPEPDLPPLIIEEGWIECVRKDLPELPRQKQRRLMRQYQLSAADSGRLVEDPAIANYFEACVNTAPIGQVRAIYNWITGELFGWMNHKGVRIEQIKVPPTALVGLLEILSEGKINLNTAKKVFSEMLTTGKNAQDIIAERNLSQVFDHDLIFHLVQMVLKENIQELNSYLGGKENLANWFFGQVMQVAGGKANPQIVRAELIRQLEEKRRPLLD